MLPEMARGSKHLTTTFALESRIKTRSWKIQLCVNVEEFRRPIIITANFGKNSMHSTSPTGQILPYLALSPLSKSLETSVAGLE